MRAGATDRQWLWVRGLTAAAAVALVTMTAAGCGGSSSNSSADTAFLSAVHLADPNINTYRSDTELLRLGHAACDGFRAGASYQELADRLALEEGSNALPSQDLGDVITSAVDGLCPQFRSLVSAAVMTGRTGLLPIDATVRET